MLTCLADLFANIASQKKKVGVLAPKKFVARLRKENGRAVINIDNELTESKVNKY